MNAWQKAIEVVESSLKAGIAEFVVCAGARNAALLEALARAEKAGLARIWRHFEERSAGFFALGRTMETGNPCAVVTTSGTAVAELLSPVIEAFYQARPLVAITADRPEQFRGTGAPQTMDQVGIFGEHAWTGGLEGWDGKRPLHWNVELEEAFIPGNEDFEGATVGEFVAAKDRIDVARLARWLREETYRGLVVLIGGLEPEEREEVYHFCRTLDAPVVAEATSGLREALQGLSIPDADRVLKLQPPGKILRLGEVPSGRFWRDLEDLPDVSVWSVCRNGLPGLARTSDVIRGSLARVLPALGDIEPVEDALDYLPLSSGRAAVIDELVEAYPDSEPGLVRTLSHYVSVGSALFLGNSLPIREWNVYSQRERPVQNVRANRGVNGIDGQVSTWMGWTADLTDAWAVVGDLTALYDMAAPFVIEQVNNQGRVLAIINNGGGQIFGRLPRLESMNPRAAECLLNPHAADLAGLAKLWGMNYLRISRTDDFDGFESTDRMLLLEIVPDAGQTADFWKEWDRLAPRL